ncbi:MAG: hypothetical protein JNM56_32435 [Planctomycetia bacterium]|nr:hypothetical protein [Planctomycetia bacterium]
MLLEPLNQLDFDASWDRRFEPTPDGSLFLMGLRSGRMRVLNADFTARHEFAVPVQGSWKISPDSRLLVLVDGSQLAVVSLDGQLLYREESPSGIGGPLDDFKFTADQRFLWTVRHYPEYQIEVQVRDTATWQVLRSAQFPEPAPPASLSLHPHPEGKVMAIWAASGQDGQWVYWAYDDGRAIQVYEVPGLDFTTPPEFHPSGSEFLLTHHYDYLERYRFPECELWGSLEWDDEDDDHQLGCNPYYLSDQRAFISSNEERAFLVDLERMCFVDEIILKGHEPRRFHGERTLSTDVAYYQVVGRNQLMTLHWDSPEYLRTDKAILWNACSLFGSFSPLRDGAPYTAQLLQMHGWH